MQKVVKRRDGSFVIHIDESTAQNVHDALAATGANGELESDLAKKLGKASAPAQDDESADEPAEAIPA